MIRIVDRYLIREILVPLALALVVLTFVLEIPTLLREAEAFIARGASWTMLGRALWALLPHALSLTIPMSVMFGILVGFGRLSADREFVALQACGVSLVRLLRPIGVIALLGTAATAYETMVALPQGNQTFREITLKVLGERIENEMKPQVFFNEFPNRVIYARDVPTGGGWRDVLVADMSRPGYMTLYVAREGQIRLDHDKKLVQLLLSNGAAHTTSLQTPDVYDGTEFERMVITLDPKTVFRGPPPRGVPEMTRAELRTAIAEGATRGDPASAERFMLNLTVSLPVSCPILALIALALGASNRKDGRLASFALGFGVVTVYYVLLYGPRAFALGGRINPSLAPWIPNIVFSVAAVALIIWRARAADQPLPFSVSSITAAVRRLSRRSPSALPSARRSSSGPGWRLWLPIRLLDRYVAREYVAVFFLGVVGLLGIFYISTFIDLADKLFRGEATPGLLLRYFFFETPRYLYFVIPMAVLLATLVTVGILTKNSELLVMRACGISLYRSAIPLLLFGVVTGIALFMLQERVLPYSNREADRLNGLIRGYPPIATAHDRRWLVASNGDIYHYDLFEPEANRFTRLWTYHMDQDTWRLNAITFVNEAVLRSDWPADASGEDAPAWEGRHGWRRTLLGQDRPVGDAAGSLAYSPIATARLPLESPGYFESEPIIAEQLPYGKLRDYAHRLQASGADAVPYLVSLHRKIAFPLVTLVMTLIALPFAVTTGRRGALYGIGVGIVLAITYWVTLSVSGALGTGGVLPPLLAAWAPNILFGAGAVYLVLTVRT